MGRQARKPKGDAEHVQCETCFRWCFLDETDFESLADAEEARSFTCRMCAILDEAVRRMEGERAAGVEEFRRELQLERQKRAELETQVGELLRREAGSAGLVERLAGELQEEREKRARLEERVELLARTESEPVSGQRHVEGEAGVGAREEAAGASDSTEAPRTYSAVAQQVPDEAEAATDRVTSGSPVRRAGAPQRQAGQVPQSGGQQSRAGDERFERRRVLVVGDSNIARVEEGVLAKVRADRRVKVEAQSGKCIVDAMAKAREVVWDNMENENLVVIHAGLNDVLKGRSQNLERQLEVGLRKLREASEKVHVTICTIPEVQGQSSGMERIVVEANRVIRGMSRRLGYGVMEVNRDVYEAGSHPFAQDGIHYSGATGRRVGSRIGCQATAFLGGPRALRAPE
ncbi:uncharacterized protein ISCGN_003097 [Ixodes scapularis]